MKYYLSLNVPYVFGSLNTVASVFMLTVRRCCIVLRFSKHSMFHIALKTEPNVNFGRTANMGLKSVQEMDEYLSTAVQRFPNDSYESRLETTQD